MRALLAACGSGGLPALRNRALVVVLWRAGLRCAEALALRPSDVDFDAGTVRVLHGKGRKARTVGIDDQALDVVRVWLEARTAAGIPVTAPLFCRLHPQRGEKLSARYVRYVMTRLGADAEVDHRVHAHGLRHTMAVEWVTEGVPVTKISRQLGHASIGTTQTYIDHLHPADVIAVGRSRSW